MTDTIEVALGKGASYRVGKPAFAREVTASVTLLALAGSSVGGVLGVVQMASAALGR